MKYKIREEVLNVSRYIAGKPIDEVKRELGLNKVIKLASNENPLGCSPMVKDKLRKVIEKTNLYPDSSSFELKEVLSQQIGVKSSQIFCGAGSDSLIKVICNTLLNEDDESIMGEITFPRYETNTKLMGGKCIKVPMKNLTLDIENMVNAITPKSKIIWFCNPNNPTGSIFTEEELIKVLELIPQSVYIVMDEAYVEYVTSNKYPDSLKLLKKFSNIIILRTFSKAYGLASLRIGYGIANEVLTEYFNRVINPFDVNLFGQVAAVEALKDKQFIEYVKTFNKGQREYMIKEFNKMGISTIESQTNFIMVNVKCNDKELFDYLLKNGYIIRPGYLLGVSGWVRISIGKEDENKEILNLIKEYLNK